MRAGTSIRSGSLCNEPFYLKELDSASEWMRGAESRNYELGSTQGKIDMDAGHHGGNTTAASKYDGKGLKFSETSDTADITFILKNNSSAEDDCSSDSDNYKNIISNAWKNEANIGNTDIELTVATFKKLCKVEIRPRSVIISKKNSPSVPYFLALPLPQAIEVDDSTYTLNMEGAGLEIEFSLVKCSESPWYALY